MSAQAVGLGRGLSISKLPKNSGSRTEPLAGREASPTLPAVCVSAWCQERATRRAEPSRPYGMELRGKAPISLGTPTLWTRSRRAPPRARLRFTRHRFTSGTPTTIGGLAVSPSSAVPLGNASLRSPAFVWASLSRASASRAHAPNRRRRAVSFVPASLVLVRPVSSVCRTISDRPHPRASRCEPYRSGTQCRTLATQGMRALNPVWRSIQSARSRSSTILHECGERSPFSYFPVALFNCVL